MTSETSKDSLLGLPITGASKEITDKALEDLQRGVDSIRDSDTFRDYLSAQARFWHYSPNNALLIMMQDPHATRVAAYQTWKELGRQVQKAEHGIKVFYPIFRRTVLPAEEEDQDPQIIQKLVAFGLGNVFDIRQTQGKPLPAPPEVPVLDSDAGEDLFLKMNLVAHREGLSVKPMGSDRPNPDIMGWYEVGNKLIVLRDDVSQLQKTKTMAHELGHHFHGPADLLFTSSSERETIAESVSYVTLARYGLDSGERSFPYIATWMKDQDQLRRAMGKIQHISRALITKIDGVAVGQAQQVAERPYVS